MKRFVLVIILLGLPTLVHFIILKSKDRSSDSEIAPAPPRFLKIVDASDDSLLKIEIEMFFEELEESVGVEDYFSIETMLDSLEYTVGLDLDGLAPERATEFRDKFRELAPDHLYGHRRLSGEGRMRKIYRLENGDVIVSWMWMNPSRRNYPDFEHRWWLRYTGRGWKIFDQDIFGVRLSVAAAARANEAISEPLPGLPPTILFSLWHQNFYLRPWDGEAKCRAAEELLDSDPAPELRAIVNLEYAGVLHLLGQLDQARSRFEMVLETPGFPTRALLEAGDCLRDLGDFDGALELAEKYLEEVGPTATGYELFASIHLAAGDREAARENAILGLRLLPTSMRCLSLAVQATPLDQQGQLSKFLSRYTEEVHLGIQATSQDLLSKYIREVEAYVDEIDSGDIEIAYSDILDYADRRENSELFDRVFEILTKHFPESEMIPSYEELRMESLQNKSEASAPSKC